MQLHVASCNAMQHTYRLMFNLLEAYTFEGLAESLDSPQESLPHLPELYQSNTLLLS